MSEWDQLKALCKRYEEEALKYRHHLEELIEAAKPVMTMEEWDKGYLGEIADDLGKAIIAAEEALK